MDKNLGIHGSDRKNFKLHQTKNLLGQQRKLFSIKRFVNKISIFSGFKHKKVETFFTNVIGYIYFYDIDSLVVYCGIIFCFIV